MSLISNFAVTVTSGGRPNLARSVEIACSPYHGAAAWSIHPDYGMVLYWHLDTKVMSPDAQVVPLPFRLDHAAITELIWGWLGSADAKSPAADHWLGEYPDVDGSVVQAWTLTTSLGYGQNYAMLAVKPVWGEIHK